MSFFSAVQLFTLDSNKFARPKGCWNIYMSEQTSENEPDWRLKTPTTIANTSVEEDNIITKTPVAIQQYVDIEIEVGCVLHAK